MSCLVALQHECAHAFAAARLGYSLRTIVLMPFGAVIDGDMQNITLKDEISVALAGPLCNLFTAGFFVALWWLAPTVYAFTDVACYSSLCIALVNLLPAYPLDGGRVFKACLTRGFLKKGDAYNAAEQKAGKICRTVTLSFAILFFLLFLGLCVRGTPNFTLLAFGGFLLLGGLGNKNKDAVYARMDFSAREELRRGVEIRRVAVLESCPIKNVLQYIVRGSYLVLEVYDENEKRLFQLPQNQLADWFLLAKTPHETLGELRKMTVFMQKNAKNAQNL